MKKFLLIVAASVAFMLTGCAELGLDGSILDRIEDLEERVSEVETLVNADKNGLVITSVQEVVEGYLIIFSDGSSVTVKHGKDGADGADGQDGENGSAGENGSNGSCTITSVEIGADSVTFNLSDGSTVVIPLQEGAVTPANPSLSISFDYSHIDVVMPYQVYSIPYTVESKSDYVNVEAFSSNSYFMIVTTIPSEEDNKKGIINFVLIEDMSDLLGDPDLGADMAESLALGSRITVLATDGKSVIMETIKLENGIIAYSKHDARDIIVEREGGVLQLPFFTNTKYDVKFYDYDNYYEEVDWLTLVEDTRAIEEKTLNVQVSKNDTGVARQARVWIYSGNIEEETDMGISYYIHQNASGEVAVNEIEWTVGYEGGYFEGYELPFALVCYGGYMSCEESCDWLDCSLYSYNGYFDCINVDYNDTYEERTATITIQEDFHRYEYDEYEDVVERSVEMTTNIITVVQKPLIVRATIAEFLAAAEDATVYELTGEITRVTNTLYGNFDITDETGTVYVYGLLSPEGESKVQWAAAGLKEGDIITIQGTRSSYLGTPQMKDAKYISHVAVDQDTQDIEFDDALARFQGEWYGNTWWVLYLLDEAGDNLFQLLVNTPGDNTAAAGIPTGKYEVAGTVEPFTITEGYINEEGYATGSLVLNTAQTMAKDLVTDGVAYITNNGDGTYAIDVDFVGYNGNAIGGTYEGAMRIVDDTQSGGGDQGGDLAEIPLSITEAEAYWYGNGRWILYLIDPVINGGKGCAMQFFVVSDTTAFADGLPSGAYTVAETAEPNTILASFQDEEGYLDGSLALTANMQSYYDLVTSGSLIVDKKGNDSYAFEFAVGGSRYLLTGAYDGAVTVIDATQQAAAPLKAKIAPLAPQKAFKAGNAKKGSNLKVSPLMTARAAGFKANKVVVF